MFTVMSPLQLLYTYTRAKPCDTSCITTHLWVVLLFCGSVFSPPHASLPDASDIAPFSLNAQQKGFSYTSMHSFWKPDWSLNSADTRPNSVHNVPLRSSHRIRIMFITLPLRSSARFKISSLAATNRRPLFFRICFVAVTSRRLLLFETRRLDFGGLLSSYSSPLFLTRKKFLKKKQKKNKKKNIR